MEAKEPNYDNIFFQIGRHLKKRWIYIFILSLIPAILIGIYFYSQPGVYTCTSKIFPLSANSAKNSANPLEILKGKLGIEGGGADAFNLNELVKSKSVALKVINVRSNNKEHENQPIYKLLIKEYNDNLGWFADTMMYIPRTGNDSLNIQFFAMGAYRNAVAIEELPTGFTILKTKAYTQELAKELNENILLTISNFYIDFVTEKPRSDLKLIQNMKDSLSSELAAVEKAIAGQVDQSAFGVKASVGLNKARLERRFQEIASIYQTTAATLQNAKFQLLSESPIFQVLDYPGAPYGFDVKPWKKFALAAFVFFAIMWSLFFCRKIIWNVIIRELAKV